MSTSEFALDPRLAADTTIVTDLPLCRVCLMNDARFAWLILVPRRAGMSEIEELAAADQADLWAEVNRAGAALRACVALDKLNIGALGNIVRQLHVHVVARSEGDAAWPGPVWGAGDARPYDAAASAKLVAQLRRALA
ncbi:MAG TPA: HIT family protein [Rhodanobacteraceae bacterium]